MQGLWLLKDFRRKDLGIDHANKQYKFSLKS